VRVFEREREIGTRDPIYKSVCNNNI